MPPVVVTEGIRLPEIKFPCLSRLSRWWPSTSTWRSTNTSQPSVLICPQRSRRERLQLKRELSHRHQFVWMHFPRMNCQADQFNYLPTTWSANWHLSSLATISTEQMEIRVFRGVRQYASSVSHLFICWSSSGGWADDYLKHVEIIKVFQSAWNRNIAR